MMTSLIIGALAMATLWLIVEYSRKKGIKPPWWAWTLTVLAICYGVFVLELVVGFVDEGAFRAALVMGVITSLFGVIWGILLRRFVFAASQKR